jgi:hypothetical protein
VDTFYTLHLYANSAAKTTTHAMRAYLKLLPLIDHVQLPMVDRMDEAEQLAADRAVERETRESF